MNISIYNISSISLSLSISTINTCYRYCCKQRRRVLHLKKCLNLPGQRRQDDVCRSQGMDLSGDASMAITTGSTDVARTPLTHWPLFLVGWPCIWGILHHIPNTCVINTGTGNFSVPWPWTIHVLFCLASNRLELSLLIWTFRADLMERMT